MRNRLVGMLTTCVVLALPAAAWGTPTWLAPSSLSQSGHEALFVNAAMGAEGGAAVAWWREDGSSYDRIQAATRSPFGSFGPPLTLSPESRNGEFAQVAEDGAGDATVVWEDESVSPASVEVATVVDGIPSSPMTISETTSGHQASYPTVAMDERGDTVLAWEQYNGSDNIVEAAFRPAGGSFGAPVALSAAGESAEYARAAIDAAGVASVVWSRNDGSDDLIEEATGSAGGFGSATALSGKSESSSDPFVAMNAEGDTAVSWVGDDIAQVAIRPAGGAFGAPVSLSETGGSAEFPQVALDGHGDPTVVWSRDDAVQVRSGTVSGSFPSAPTSIAYPAQYASVAEDPAGDTLVGYDNDQERTASAAFRPAGGLFTAPQVASPPGGEVETDVEGDELGINVAMDGQGDGLFGFRARNGSEPLAYAALFDAAGPLLNALSVPASATAGTPVAFSVAPSDQLSGVVGTTWSFGDASTASGDSVTHTFAEPGTYTVSVTSTDGVGNSSTRTATIAVAAPPAPPAFKAASLGSSTVTVDSHGRVHLKILCPAGGAACAGTVTLTLPATATGLAVAASAKPQGTPVTVAAGHASFGAAAGGSETVSIALPEMVAKLLTQHHHLTLTAAVESHGSSGQGATASGKLLVKAYVKPKHSKKPKRKKKK